MAARSPVQPKPPAAPERVAPYDFRQPDRVGAGQLRTLRSIHENFARGLGWSLSAYLRNLVSIDLTGVEQLSLGEFSRRTAQPLTLMALRMRPLEARAILQLSHAALFPILEILMGGSGKSTLAIDRDITEIERTIASPVLRILVEELRSAWHAVSPVEFAVEDDEAARQLISALPQNQELLAIGFEIRLCESTGVLNLGLPSRALRALLQDALPSSAEPAAGDSAQMLRLIQDAQLNAEIRLNGPTMLFRDLLNIEPGDVLTFDHPVTKEVELELNGTPKFKGRVVAAGNKRAFQVSSLASVTTPTGDRSPESCLRP